MHNIKQSLSFCFRVITMGTFYCESAQLLYCGFFITPLKSQSRVNGRRAKWNRCTLITAQQDVHYNVLWRWDFFLFTFFTFLSFKQIETCLYSITSCAKPRAGLSDCDCLIFNDIMGSTCLVSYFTLRERRRRCFENMPDLSQAQSNNNPLNINVISFRASQNK